MINFFYSEFCRTCPQNITEYNISFCDDLRISVCEILKIKKSCTMKIVFIMYLKGFF